VLRRISPSASGVRKRRGVSDIGWEKANISKTKSPDIRQGDFVSTRFAAPAAVFVFLPRSVRCAGVRCAGDGRQCRPPQDCISLREFAQFTQ
jgi:hypothetical protein